MGHVIAIRPFDWSSARPCGHTGRPPPIYTSARAFKYKDARNQPILKVDMLELLQNMADKTKIYNKLLVERRDNIYILQMCVV